METARSITWYRATWINSDRAVDLSGSVGRCAYDLDHGCCKLPM